MPRERLETGLDGNWKDTLFDPLMEAAADVTERRCPKYPYEEHLMFGVQRVLTHNSSGRDFVQKILNSICPVPLSVRNFFDALASGNRLEYMERVNDRLFELCSERLPDQLDSVPELEEFEVYAGDNHYHGHAVHDATIDGKKYPTGHLYFMDMRTNLVRHLDKGEGKKEHDISILKRHSGNLLPGRLRRRRALIVYDRGGIDFNFWWRQKKSKGVYFLSREKSNMALKDNIVGLKEFDASDPRNAGIVSDELCGTSAHVMVRRVTYKIPGTENTIVFVTNEMSLPPGVLAWLYKLRWRLEKVFDQFKNAFLEKKAWCANDTGKKQQAIFMCLAHNLLNMLMEKLDAENGVAEEKRLSRRMEEILEYKKKMMERGMTPNPLLTRLQKPAQCTLQFLRVLRDRMFVPTSWNAFVGLVKPAMQAYLN